jgi:hypothetical protein
MGGTFSDIEPLLSANGPQDIVDRITILQTLGDQNTNALERYKAAEVVARAAKVVADAAKVKQLAATEKVAAAKKVADDAKALQQKEVDKLRAVQDKLIKELAKAKNVRITLQQQRQLALLEEAQAGQAVITPGQAKFGQTRASKAAQQLEPHKSNVIKQLLLLRNKF